MCYARPPANKNDTTGDSVVLSLLWPQTLGRTKSFGSLTPVDLATTCHLVIVCGIIDLIPTSNRRIFYRLHK
jgi:hypothetical protein